MKSTTPALFCAGILDGRTPVPNAEAALRGFPNGQLIVIDGMGREEPAVLLDNFETFPKDGEVGVESIALPLRFDPVR